MREEVYVELAKYHDEINTEDCRPVLSDTRLKDAASMFSQYVRPVLRPVMISDDGIDQFFNTRCAEIDQESIEEGLY